MGATAVADSSNNMPRWLPQFRYCDGLLRVRGFPSLPPSARRLRSSSPPNCAMRLMRNNVRVRREHRGNLRIRPCIFQLEKAALFRSAQKGRERLERGMLVVAQHADERTVLSNRTTS